MSLKLKLNLQFDEPLLFRGFLPEAESDFLRLYLQDRKCNVTLYLSNRQTQLSPFDVVPSDSEQLKESRNTINTHGLTLELDFITPNPDVVSALEAEQPTEKLRAFVQETFDLVVRIYNGIIEYLRNIEKQYWLRPILYETYRYVIFLANANVYWLDTNGNWREFPKPNISQYPLETRITGPDVTLDRDTAINRDKWINEVPMFLGEFIENRKRAKSIDSFIANAYCHLEQQNNSLAIIEAVRALEQFIKNRLPKVICDLTQTRELAVEEREIDSLFKKAGITAVTLLVFGLMGRGMGLASEDIVYIQRAIELRNEILHFARDRVEFSEANKCVSAIHRATRL